jgi:hypothetical protein
MVCLWSPHRLHQAVRPHPLCPPIPPRLPRLGPMRPLRTLRPLGPLRTQRPPRTQQRHRMRTIQTLVEATVNTKLLLHNTPSLPPPHLVISISKCPTRPIKMVDTRACTVGMATQRTLTGLASQSLG